jgi:exosortase/archaeosortase family protein
MVVVVQHHIGIVDSAVARLRTLLPRNSVRRVAVTFVLLLAVLLPLTMFSGAWRGWSVLTGATAAVSGAAARGIGLNATVSGSVISLPSRSLVIDIQCTAVALLAIYIALVLAYPVGARMRILAVAVGIPVLVAANIARIVGVAVASEHLVGRTFYMVHDYLFESVMVLVVLMMWAVWLSFARRNA